MLQQLQTRLSEIHDPAIRGRVQDVLLGILQDTQADVMAEELDDTLALAQGRVLARAIQALRLQPQSQISQGEVRGKKTVHVDFARLSEIIEAEKK